MARSETNIPSGASDNNSLDTGEREVGGNKPGPLNVDTNKYDYKKSKRDAQGYTGPTGVYEGQFTDNADDEGWKDSPLADNRLVKGGGWKAALSGSHEQPKFTDYSGGKSTRGYNKAAMQFIDADEAPKAKGSRQNDWRGSK